MNQTPIIGKVIIAGAGPGAPELITVKLMEALGIADVIITDRLVNPTIIERYASKKAILILAGKQGYTTASISQCKLSELIIQHALKGQNVLRLKGGDVALFSNVLEELNALRQHQIPYEIIPGITAASGASAYTGIPLTARGYAQGVQFLTFQHNDFDIPERWKNITRSSETLVFYMAAQHLVQVARQLLFYGTKPSTAIAVIEQATTMYQQVHISTLERCENEWAAKPFSSPSLVIVGDVVQLHFQFQWYTPSTNGTVFPDLHIPATIN